MQGTSVPQKKEFRNAWVLQREQGAGRIKATGVRDCRKGQKLQIFFSLKTAKWVKATERRECRSVLHIWDTARWHESKGYQRFSVGVRCVAQYCKISPAEWSRRWICDPINTVTLTLRMLSWSCHFLHTTLCARRTLKNTNLSQENYRSSTDT